MLAVGQSAKGGRFSIEKKCLLVLFQPVLEWQRDAVRPEQIEAALPLFETALGEIRTYPTVQWRSIFGRTSPSCFSIWDLYKMPYKVQ